MAYYEEMQKLEQEQLLELARQNVEAISEAVDAVESLIKKWRDEAKEARQEGEEPDLYIEDRRMIDLESNILKKCANELEAIL